MPGDAVSPTHSLCLRHIYLHDTQQPDKQLADIAKEDKNLMDIMVSGEESVKGGRRGSFVKASRHRSSRSLLSHADSYCDSPAPNCLEIGSSKPRHGEVEASPDDVEGTTPSRGRSQLKTSPLSNNSSLQMLDDKPICPNEGNLGSRERPYFPYTRRSSQIRPLLSSIEASIRAASADRSDARMALENSSGARIACTN